MKFLAALAAIAAAVAYVMLTGWLFMLTVGVIRGEWLSDLPTIGYGSAVLVSAMLTSLFATTRAQPKSSD